MKILSFGHIPTWAGGRQNSGLANVIYQLAKHCSEDARANVVLAATDCFVPSRKDGLLTILGWTKKMLTFYALTHPQESIKSAFKLRQLKQVYPLRERFLGLYFKRLFLKKSLEEQKPDIVHLHGTSAIYYIDLVPREIKSVITFHGMCGVDKNLPQHEVHNDIEHYLFHSERVDGRYFICTQIVSDFKKAYGDNQKDNHVIFNSYDSRLFFYAERPQKKDRKITLCTIASLSDVKGQMRVLQALAQMSKDEFRYFCIGGDSNCMAAKLEAYARLHDIDFKYLGKMKPDGIREHLYQADYMIMPSSSEGFGLTYLEAIACGVPVILPCDIPIAAERELINEQNSVMLESCLTDAISKVLPRLGTLHFDHSKVANTISKQGWKTVSQQYIESFKNILHK